MTKNMFKERNKRKNAMSEVTELLFPLLFMCQAILTVTLEVSERRSTPVKINTLVLSLGR